MDRAPRYDINQRLSLRVLDSGEELRGVSQNVSETGVLIRAHRSVLKGTEVEVTFPDFAAAAEVIWTRESEESALVGLKFLRMSRKDRKALTHLLATPAKALR